MSKFDMMGESQIDIMTPLGNLVTMLDNEIKHGRSGATVKVIVDNSFLCNLKEAKISEVEPGKLAWMFWIEKADRYTNDDTYCSGTLRDEIGQHKNLPVVIVLRETEYRGNQVLRGCKMSGEFGNESGTLIIRAANMGKFLGIKTFMKQLGGA